jgi:A/G-specific adenine glycosylase
MQKLNRWYNENKRDLPWRRSRDPYLIWISEIMLQQTTVTTVKPYFERFIQTFPNVNARARAPEEKVLSLWSGLGYYSRARNLQKAAKAIVDLGRFPNNYNALLELPGIGPYTAAAIASIAFGQEVAAIDGNVIRVITRLFNIEGNIGLKGTQKIISQRAYELVLGQDPSSHNQGMMELGATICTPKNPSCLICPVFDICKARKAGVVLERPVKTKNSKFESWVWHMEFIENPQGKIALIKSENGTPWLNHLWVLPGRAIKWKRSKAPKADFKHSITRHKIFVQLQVMEYAKFKKTKNIKWMSLREIEKVGVSSIVMKALKHHSRSQT